jgi:hypothetical protein
MFVLLEAPTKKASPGRWAYAFFYINYTSAVVDYLSFLIKEGIKSA